VSLVVVGTDTGVGKTVTCAVILARYASGLRLGYWKPVQTGPARERDATFVRKVVGDRVDVLREAYAFDPPLSPHLAARLSGASVDPEKILGALVSHALADERRSLVIEGVGGVLVPLTETGYLLADLCRDMSLPCIVVARSGLGTINHSLLTLEALRARKVAVAGVILCGPGNPENRTAVERFGRVEVLAEVPSIRRPVGRASVLRAARGFDRRGKLKEYLA
jgi:malonyl-CoA O-methyltransferase